MTDLLPLSLRFAWWGTAWLRGLTSADDLLDAVRGEDAQHLVAHRGHDGTIELDGLLIGMGRARSAGATAVGLCLPVEGDPVGLGGPAEFNHAALESGEAVLLLGTGTAWVPERTGRAVTWMPFPAARRQIDDLGASDRALRASVPTTADALARLDVARWRPEVADELLNLGHYHLIDAPPGTPEKCRDLASRALVAQTIVDLALADDGGAVSASEMTARRDALVPLERTARRALVAAASPEVWPH